MTCPPAARPGGLSFAPLALNWEDAGMQTLIPNAERLAHLLRERGETVAVAESSAGGLVAAALLERDSV